MPFKQSTSKSRVASSTTFNEIVTFNTMQKVFDTVIHCYTTLLFKESTNFKLPNARTFKLFLELNTVAEEEHRLIRFGINCIYRVQQKFTVFIEHSNDVKRVNYETDVVCFVCDVSSLNRDRIFYAGNTFFQTK